ncbi:MAG: hypothetical protein KC474_08320 [Cyanobacteria bacterium HKST-UBA04]|nr:hypothetical protein [Cyanobacteria bacterium HKST-UBA04]
MMRVSMVSFGARLGSFVKAGTPQPAMNHLVDKVEAASKGAFKGSPGPAILNQPGQVARQFLLLTPKEYAYAYENLPADMPQPAQQHRLNQLHAHARQFDTVDISLDASDEISGVDFATIRPEEKTRFQ